MCKAAPPALSVSVQRGVQRDGGEEGECATHGGHEGPHVRCTRASCPCAPHGQVSAGRVGLDGAMGQDEAVGQGVGLDDSVGLDDAMGLDDCKGLDDAMGQSVGLDDAMGRGVGQDDAMGLDDAVG